MVFVFYLCTCLYHEFSFSKSKVESELMNKVQAVKLIPHIIPSRCQSST